MELVPDTAAPLYGAQSLDFYLPNPSGQHLCVQPLSSRADDKSFPTTYSSARILFPCPIHTLQKRTLKAWFLCPSLDDSEKRKDSQELLRLPVSAESLSWGKRGEIKRKR